MRLIKHVSKRRKEPVWEVVMDGESIKVTTGQLQRHALFKGVIRRLMASSASSPDAGAFWPLMQPMSRGAWEQLVRDALAHLQTVSD